MYLEVDLTGYVRLQSSAEKGHHTSC